MLRENTAGFKARAARVEPITGFSCWALGYLDPEYRLVGCLLHPARNSGRDMRYRVAYGEKCRRETCREARIFEELDPEVQAFWLRLADGLDCFQYSSRRENPLFTLLNWGPGILEAVAREESCSGLEREAFFYRYPFFKTPLPPQAAAYPAERLVLPDRIGLFKREAFARAFETLYSSLSEQVRSKASDRGNPTQPHTHRLPLEKTFLDFVRLSTGIRRISLEAAASIKHDLDRRIREAAPRLSACR
jgi:hypothetical protein